MIGLASSAGSFAFNTGESPLCPYHEPDAVRGQRVGPSSQKKCKLTCSVRIRRTTPLPASSYVWRNDASTSATPSSATAESKAGPSPSFAHGRRSHNNSSASRTPADEARQRVARPAHRRRESGLPSSAGTSSARPAHGHANGQRSPRSSSGSGRSKGAAGSTSSATASTSTGKTPAGDKSTLEAIKMVDEMNLEEDLYKILGVHRRAKTEEVRRAFLNRSRICHPE